MKSPNNAGTPAAEGAEGRGLAKGNLRQQNASRTPSRIDALSALERVRQAARRDKKMRFTALLHHIYRPETLRQAYLSLKRDAAPGVDGQTWRHYGEALEENLLDLSERLKRGAYRAKPVRRVYIAKTDGRQRPLGIPTLEDKLVQRATVEVLNVIYEADFLGFSYGFRPKRSQHHGLDALYTGLLTRKVNWVLDADIRGYFDAIDRGWLVKFIGHRIADRRVVRLIQKWLNAGVLEDETRTWSETGTPQGGSADDILLGFQHRTDAERFRNELAERFRKFGLELHPDKTRLLEFGPFAAENRRRRGGGKPETFDFLGFTHICGKKRNGRFTVLRQTKRKRLQAKLARSRPEGRSLAALGGRRAYPVLRRAHELPGARAVSASSGVAVAPCPVPSQSEGTRALGPYATPHLDLAPTRAHLSSLSSASVGRHHLRQEPDAVMPLVRIRGGGDQ